MEHREANPGTARSSEPGHFSDTVNPVFRQKTSARRFYKLLWASVLCLTGLGLPSVIPQALADNNQYVYDEAGRLTGVIDSSGATAQYRYDALGNIVSIERSGAASVSIIGFTPSRGPQGTSVTIRGNGFSAIASQNTVKFGEVVATATSAEPTSLSVTVPVGATTGKISVISPTGTATSTTDFEVAAAVNAPTIDNISPLFGYAGATVVITGTNFDTSPLGNKVLFNKTPAFVSAATTTSITVRVPEKATTGKIQVDTIGGTATSAAEFIIPPSIVGNSSSIIASAVAAVGGAEQVLDISSVNKVGC